MRRLKEYSPFPPHSEVKLPVRAWCQRADGTFEVGYRPDNSESITDVSGVGITLEAACLDANVGLYISARRWWASEMRRRRPAKRRRNS